MKNYKYKREHFSTQEEYDQFKANRTKWAKKWLDKKEKSNPEHRERRLLRQKLYSRYYHHTDCMLSFAEWLYKTLGISDIRSLSTADLKLFASKC